MPMFRRGTVAKNSEGTQRSVDRSVTKENMADAVTRTQLLGGSTSCYFLQHKGTLGSQSPKDGHQAIPLMSNSHKVGGYRNRGRGELLKA